MRKTTTPSPSARRARALLSCVTTLLLLHLSTAVTGAVPGAPDATFGGAGRVTTDFASGADTAEALLLRPDGKIVAAGYTNVFVEGACNCDGYDFALARYNHDGSLDAGFGAQGRVTTDFAGKADLAFAAAAQPDGKLVLAGYANGVTFGQVIPSPGKDLALARYNADGSPDADFGVGGKVVADLGNSEDELRAVAVQPDGKIVAAGFTYQAFTTQSRDLVLARYLPDGSPDESFAPAGVRVVNPNGATGLFGGRDAEAHAVALQPDGKIVVGGHALSGSFSSADFLLGRFNQDGTLDASFGTGGWAKADFGGGDDRASAAALQPDGKVIAAGRASVSGFGVVMGLARFNPDGTLDASFGAGGRVSADFGAGQEEAFDLALQDDGRVVAAGLAFGDPFSRETQAFALARFRPDGALDPSFNFTGKVTTSLSSRFDAAFAVAVQADGRAVAAGTAFISGRGLDFALARYEGGTNLTPVARAGPDQTLPATSVGSHAVTLDGSASFDPDGDALSFAWHDASGAVLGTDPVLNLLLAPGTHAFVLKVEDGNGGVAFDTVVVAIHYSWSGVLQPVNADGSSVFNLNSTVQVKFELTGPSAGIADAPATIHIMKVSDEVTGTVLEGAAWGSDTPGNAFRHAGNGHYVYQWDTKNAPGGGTYRLGIDLGDGLARQVFVSLR